jgi:hypothetical protein
MNCYDCAVASDHRDAVAVCTDCGAGLCIEHAAQTRHWLTRTQTTLRVERVEPAARLIRCGTCHAAHIARGDIATTDDRPPARTGAT